MEGGEGKVGGQRQARIVSRGTGHSLAIEPDTEIRLIFGQSARAFYFPVCNTDALIWGRLQSRHVASNPTSTRSAPHFDYCNSSVFRIDRYM